MKSNEKALHELLHAKIESLRPKLLDLTRRNPLISTKLGLRSNSQIRAVDELPDILFFKLSNVQEMNVVPLPPIEDDPLDEQSHSFRAALTNGRLTDEAYLAAIELIDRDHDDYLENTQAIERELKDKIRTLLGLAPRIQQTEINLTQHAKNNRISPSYELPEPNDEKQDGSHTDDNIQTLLLPDGLERKLNSIISKGRTWTQETGIDVLQVAFGFLEWSDDTQSDSSFAPLVLLPIEIKRARTPRGVKYSIKGTGDDAELNTVLHEKLRIDFSIDIPEFKGGSIEAYFAAVANVLPKKKNWRLRRQVAIGVLPSARMAMYHDLDTKRPDFPQNDIVQSLLVGNNSDGGSASPFADEYDVDEPKIEAKVPCLVMDADSSQFSALVDVGDGKNVAIEGPPGTGKSQTIVNAIAAALEAGKSVLFVAEKLAALNVVKARLEAIGLGEFLLPLQAEKSAREQVIESIRDRLEMPNSRPVRDYEEQLEEFRHIRNQLADYIDLITTEFKNTGFNIHEILGKGLAASDRLFGISKETVDRCDLRSEMQTASGLTHLFQLGSNIEQAHAATLGVGNSWRETRLVNPDRFTVEDACSLTKKASDEARILVQARDALQLWQLDKSSPYNSLETLHKHLTECAGHFRQHRQSFLVSLLSNGNAEAFATFLSQCSDFAKLRDALVPTLLIEPNEAALAKIGAIREICDRYSLSMIDIGVLTEQIDAKRKFANTARAISDALAPLVSTCEGARTWALDDLSQAHDLYRNVGSVAVSLRNNKHSEGNAAYILWRLCQEGLQLRKTREALSLRLFLSVEISQDALVECASTLRTAGSLGFLSPSYRKAKRLFKSICRSKQYSASEAVQSLDALVAFRRQLDNFEKQVGGSGYFGIHFRGLDTDFEQFERLAKYLESIRKCFGGPGHTSLRTFLREATPSQLDLLPRLRQTGVSLTFASLQERIANLEGEVRRLETAASELRNVGEVFRDSQIEPVGIENVNNQLEELLSGQRNADQHELAREMLGDGFNGHRTNISDVKNVTEWALQIGSDGSAVQAVLLQGDPRHASNDVTAVLSAEEKFEATLSRLSDIAKIDTDSFTRSRPLVDAVVALDNAAKDAEGLFAFARLATVIQDAIPHGIMALVEERLRGGSLSSLGAQVEALAIRQLAKAVYATHGKRLTKYSGAKLDELRAALAKKDKEIIEQSRRQLRAKVKASARPPRGNGIGKKSTWTNMALIENEISKKQKYISIRDLAQRAAEALIALKPCWMMSPLAVAQYVPKGTVKFDLCIIDEASQMPPESAIGALLRCDQAVVVGDTNQLPPSSYFKTLIDDDDMDEDEAVLNESILELANGAFRPARRLRWHYRSRHSGLIKFSNKLVYDDKLIVFPSATESLAKMGVEYKNVKGLYKAGTNPIEARAIIDAIVEFMQTDPDRSLGVVTLNHKQRDLIIEEFERAAANNRLVQKYMDTWTERNDGLEEFFIKNLENVQGDERDVIFIGTVYGPEEPGARVMQRFGPINGIAGKRRLNVLFTRAKQKIMTFSSMTGADIEADEHSNPGVHMLRRWLEYAASGILDAGEETEKEPDSDFEVFVIDQIRAMGCQAVPQVGVAGYFVDIGVRHPDWPHGYILGVECDGATYHSAKSARDRDRLRQEILEGLGWRLHRIWSTDWFNNSRQEAERLRKIIVERLAALKTHEHEYTRTSGQSETAEAGTDTRTVQPRLLDVEQVMPSAPLPAFRTQDKEKRVEVGDTVRVRYLAGDKRTIKITISGTQSEPSRGIVHHQSPVASAILGTEEGDEIEILAGSYIQPVVVESILKNSAN
ncbi:MAG: DUF4011 domain-containing protein [Xanthobacteraceae bacterium]|jgi:transcription elongation GreA/GreB family factor